MAENILHPLVVIYNSFDCTHSFVSEELDSTLPYPSSVLYDCPACGRAHGFDVGLSFIVSTPKRKTIFADYCKEHGITDINVRVI